MLEQEIKSYLTAQKEPFKDQTKSHSDVDFFLPRNGVHLDAKEKRQRFDMRNWKEAVMPQECLFIIDDLAIRKLLRHAPHSFCLIRDRSRMPLTYYVYSIVDFLCMPKKRCRRPIRRNMTAYKGKWLLDLRDAAAFEKLEEAMNYVIGYKNKHPAIFEGHIDCWGKYYSERIGKGGRTRTANYWDEDAKAHT